MPTKNYFFVGLATLLLLGGVVSLILWKNSFFSKVKSYELIGEFESINGLLNNAVVKYRGYPVGRVSKITPKQTTIEVLFFVNESYQIPKGSSVKIVFDGLVGEKYMEILPNPTRNDFYSSGDRIVGYSSSGLSDFIDVGTQNLLELKSILKTMSSVFGSEEISHALKEVVFSMQDAAENMERVVGELSKISSSNKVTNILTQVDQLLTNLNASIKKEDLEKIKTTISNLEDFSRELKDLISDQELKKSVVSTLKETHSTFQKSNSFLNAIGQIKLVTSADFNYRWMNNDYLVYLVNFNFLYGDDSLNFGFSNYFSEDKLVNVLHNIPVGHHARFSYGLIKSSPGIGINYSFMDLPLTSTVYMYNFEDPFFDFGLTFSLSDQFMINSGYNEFNQPTRSLFFGVGFYPSN